MKMNGHRVGGLLLNRFGQTDTLGLSTDRDILIISDIFVVERVVKIPNVEGNIAFFGSRSAEQATDSVRAPAGGHPQRPAGTRRAHEDAQEHNS